MSDFQADPPADLDETAIPNQPRPTLAAESGAFPITVRDRFEPIRLLGQGGMGRVFLARDKRLGRDVALKFMRDVDSDLARRFLSEARAQARVKHEHVCQVHEVGEIEGRVYIAMEYIEGKPLGSVVDLPIEQKALLLRDAAHGVHEAHRAGIIHRDIKPSNVMVAEREDGSPWAYVMDFGLAREIDTEGQTQTGAVVGTIAYMPPEQARGDVRALDRRSDVYSLGATLYAVLAGRPPFVSEQPLQLLWMVGHEEPPSLSGVQRGIPEDLETIVMKCLEREPAQRYDSARALAEDLDRFLSGEPVEARRASAWYRLRKRLRKQRRLVAAAGVALAVSGAALGWGIKTRSEAASRERLARQYTERVERIESMARYSALSPLHDVREDHKAIRAEMGNLERDMKTAGDVAIGPGHYALGRGWMMLDDALQAREHLEKAWQAGFRQPRVAYALAVVLGDIYQSERLDAERIREGLLRDAKKREIERLYRDPALDYIRKAEGARAPSPHYVAARLASYENRLDDALTELDAMENVLPWFYEAPALRGSVLATRASQRWNQGNHAGAVADFEAGRRAYARAVAIGESVPELHEAHGELEYAAMVMELYSEGNVEPIFERGVAEVSRALTAEPDQYDALVLDARMHRRMAEHRGNRGVAAYELIQKAIASAERAANIEPTRRAARMELGNAYWQWGQARSEQGEDPREVLQKALAVFEDFPSEWRDYDYQLALGLVFETRSDHESHIGGDPQPDRGKAIEAYRVATTLNESLPSAWLNLGNAYLLRASYPRDEDPDGDLAESLAALAKAREKNPLQIMAYIYGGDAHDLLGQRHRAQGKDPRPEFVAALELYRQGLKVNPKLAYLHNGVGTILIEQAREAWDRGSAPEPLLNDARSAFEQAITVAPDQGFGYHNVGEACAEQVSYVFARGEDPGPAAKTAIAAIQKAIEHLPGRSAPRSTLGKVYAMLAAYEAEAGRDPAAHVAAAEATLAAALQIDPEDSRAHLSLGEARAAGARYRFQKGGGTAGDLNDVAREYEKAIELSPEDQGSRIALGLFRCFQVEVEQAAGRDPAPVLSRGLEQAAALLSVRPNWPDARILRANIILLQAELGAADERRERASRALADFRAALATNTNLSGRWKERVTIAQRLAAAP